MVPGLLCGLFHSILIICCLQNDFSLLATIVETNSVSLVARVSVIKTFSHCWRGCVHCIFHPYFDCQMLFDFSFAWKPIFRLFSLVGSCNFFVGWFNFPVLWLFAFANGSKFPRLYRQWKSSYKYRLFA